MLKIKEINAGLVILKKHKGEIYTLIGSYQDKNNEKIYTFPGGSYSKIYDKTSLHTAVRELIEEVFNIKIAQSKLDEIVKNINEKELLIDEYIYKPKKFITYFGDFKILNFIFKSIYNYKFNLYEFLAFRNKKINEEIIAKDGLDEFVKIHFIKLNDLNNTKIKLRLISKYVLNQIYLLFDF